MTYKKSFAVGLSVLALFACSSSEPLEETSVGDIPEWILNPNIEDGIAVSDCVLFSGNMSIDRKQAIAQARVLLAAEIETRVKGLDETYQDKVQVNNESTSGSTFASVSQQITEQTLVGAKAIKTDIVDISGKDNLCVLVGMQSGETRDLYEKLVKASNKNLSPQDDDVLYQEFKAERAQGRLKEALEN